MPRERGAQLRRLGGMQRAARGMAEVGERRERREPAGRFGAVGAEDARAVAGEVDALRAAAAVGIDARQPLAAQRLEREFAAREVGELRLGAQMPAERDRIALEALLGVRVRRARAPPCTPTLIVAVDARAAARPAAA